MKPRFKLIFSMLCFIILCAFALHHTTQLNQAAWLLGTWENKTSRGSLYENWTSLSTTEYAGKSFKVNGKDTMVFENIKLLQQNDSLFYIPIVSNQNGGQPIRFTNISLTDSQMIFENKNHDFPQIISYTKVAADSIIAVISGVKNGKEHKQAFPMKLVK